jgi:hypothetical protein
MAHYLENGSCVSLCVNLPSSAPIDYMRAFVIDDELFNQSASETAPGGHAVLRSKIPLTPKTLLEMSVSSPTLLLPSGKVPFAGAQSLESVTDFAETAINTAPLEAYLVHSS